jgi:3-phytase
MKRPWLILSCTLLAADLPRKEIRPLVETKGVAFDVDDPAIWVNPENAAESLIVGTIKRPKPNGGLAVYRLDGSIAELVGDIDRPNNVDISGDICVTTERLQRQLRVYRVHGDKPHLRLIGTVPVFAGEPGERGAPMGIGLYRKDAELFAILTRKTGPQEGYLWQYKLDITAQGVKGEKVREFGAFSGTGEMEAVAVDQKNGLVYYADEDCCLRAYWADPAKGNQEVAKFAETGFRGNREGIAVAGDYIIATDQIPDGSEYHIFRRQDRCEIAVWKGTARSTDGIDAIAQPMGPKFPRGFLVVMNEAARNFQLYDLVFDRTTSVERP